MVLVVEGAHQPLADQALRAMFEARKRVFVDLLKWDVPVIDGRFEVDQFDDEHAVYLIATDGRSDHVGSARLRQTLGPHILGTLFPELCAEAPPRAPEILEITRFCLSRDRSARERLETRNRLVFALAELALARGISAYTAVAEFGWLQQILAFGWHCRPLGSPKMLDGKLVGALRIEISEHTPALLAENGIRASAPLDLAAALEAA